jgi:hypothetical protein
MYYSWQFGLSSAPGRGWRPHPTVGVHCFSVETSTCLWCLCMYAPTSKHDKRIKAKRKRQQLEIAGGKFAHRMQVPTIARTLPKMRSNREEGSGRRWCGHDGILHGKVFLRPHFYSQRRYYRGRPWITGSGMHA